MIGNREYWMVCRESGILALVWFGIWLTPYPPLSSWFIEGKAFSRVYDLAPSPPPTPSPVSKFDWRHRDRQRDYLLTGEGGRGWAMSRIILPKRPWFSINHSILSDWKSRQPLSHIGTGQITAIHEERFKKKRCSTIVELPSWTCRLLTVFKGTV